MLFKKLFKLLVLSGAVMGTGSACTATAQSSPSSEKKTTPQADAGTPSDPPADGGTAGGGAQGW
jgi:hypothetical protein